MTYRINPDVRLSESADGLILLNTQTGLYTRLNSTGRLVLESLLETGSSESAIATLSSYQGSEPLQIRKDVEQLTVDLAKHKILDAQ